jgi:hypothetical protein
MSRGSRLARCVPPVLLVLAALAARGGSPSWVVTGVYSPVLQSGAGLYKNGGAPQAGRTAWVYEAADLAYDPPAIVAAVRAGTFLAPADDTGGRSGRTAAPAASVIGPKAWSDRVYPAGAVKTFFAVVFTGASPADSSHVLVSPLSAPVAFAGVVNPSVPIPLTADDLWHAVSAAPVRIAAVSVAGGSAAGGSAALSWAAVPDVSRYVVFGSPSLAPAAWEAVAETAALSCVFPPGTNRFFKMRGY